MSFRPRALPKVRDQIVRQLADPAMPIRALTGQDNQPGLDLAANHLQAAGLYWVSADMTALAMSAGGSLAAASWAASDRPSGCGLLAWDGGVGSIDYAGVPIPIDACTWGPAPGGCLIWLWITRFRVAEAAVRGGWELDEERTPPLIPVLAFTVPATADPVPMADLPEDALRPVAAALAAAWLLMQQPNLVERSVERPDKSVRRAYGRAGRQSPEVNVVDLRRQYVPRDQEAGEEAGPRRYRYRFVVSGHWRNQAYGPEHSLRRRQWVPSYVKGPDGAPLLVTEKVNVWRR